MRPDTIFRRKDAAKTSLKTNSRMIGGNSRLDSFVSDGSRFVNKRGSGSDSNGDRRS